MNEHTWRTRVESGLRIWVHLVSRHSWWVLGTSLVMVALLMSGLRNVVIDFHPESMLKPDNILRVQYDAFKSTFGVDDTVAILFHPKNGVFDLEFLRWLRDFHHAVDVEVPHIDEVTSLINIRSVEGNTEGLTVDDFLATFPSDAASASAQRARSAANPLHENLLVSQDGQYTSMLIRLATYADRLKASDDDFGGFDEEPVNPSAEPERPDFLSGIEIEESVLAVRALLDRMASSDVETYLTGNPYIGMRAIGETRNGFLLFTLVSLALIMIVLGILFRRLSGVGLPMLVTILSVAATFGFSGLTGMTLSVTAQIMPSFLLAVGIAGSVHVLVIFYQAYDGGASKEDALAQAYGHSGLPIIMAALTTAGGLASLSFSDLGAVVVLGILAPIGVIMALIFTMTTLPALLTIAPIKRRKPRESRWFGKTIVAAGIYSARKPWVVLAGAGGLVVLMGLALPRVDYVFDPLTFIAPSDPVHTSTQLFNDHMHVTSSIEVVVDTGEEDGVKTTKFLRQLDRAHSEVMRLRGVDGDLQVGKALSVVDIIKEINQALNENRAEYYTIPEGDDLVVQELVLFENAGADDLEDFVDPTFSSARLTLRMPYVAPTAHGSLLPDLRQVIAELFPAASFHITGLWPLLSAAQAEIRDTFINSYAIAAVVISILMIGLIGSFKGGLIAMIPNFAPIFITIGFMGWAGIEMSFFSLMIGSVAIGLAVDDTMHFMHTYHQYHRRHGDVERAVRETLETTGRALVTTTIVLSLGFIVFALSPLTNLTEFGVLTTLTIGLALLADITVAPALVSLMAKHAPSYPLPITKEAEA